MWNLLIWMLLGGAVGALASRVPDTEGKRNLLLYLASGVVGAVLGGTLFIIFDTTPLNLLALWSLPSAALGALVAVLVVRAVVKQTLRR